MYGAMQAVTTAVGLEFGLASSLFAVALCFTLVTMYDAAGVRYHSGAQSAIFLGCLMCPQPLCIFNGLRSEAISLWTVHGPLAAWYLGL